MTTWQYKTIWTNTVAGVGLLGQVTFKPHEIDAALDSLGREGWELVTAVALNVAEGHTAFMVYTLKRPMT